MVRLLLAFILLLPLGAQGWLKGRVTDGREPVAGVRVYPDRLRRVRPRELPPMARTAADGSFQLPLDPADDAVVFEKEGYVFRILPVAGASGSVVLTPVLGFRRDRVLVVRVALEDEPLKRSEEDLHRFLFGRQPTEASAASYIYEISLGRLLLEPGATKSLTVPGLRKPRQESDRDRIVTAVLNHLKDQDLRSFDQVNNATGEPGADGKPDHLWIIAPGVSEPITGRPDHLPVRSTLTPLPWNPFQRWPVVFFTEETPLGFVVHELLHAQGEHRVDDFYTDHANTAGGWDLMDAGQLRGWDRQHPEQGPWQEDMAYSPSHPMAWTRSELWYQGWMRQSLSLLTLKGRAWEGWLQPLEGGGGPEPQALRVPDPRKPGCFWELSVRRPWGFDRGRMGGRFGPGYQGLVVAHIDPSKLSTDGDSLGPVRVVDAHPGTREPAKPRLPGGRWQLDDAAFQKGPKGVAAGKDGPLQWQVLEEDALGRMKVRVRR